LALFQQAKDEGLGTRVVDALGEARSLASLRPEQIQTALAGFPAEVRRRAEPLLTRIAGDAPRQRERMESLAAQLASTPLPPDIRRGQAVFNSQKAACANCHAIGYLGGNLGPDLTRIGQVRSERDLLESIVLPSASFVRNYEPMVIVTRAGEEHSGVLRRDTADEMVLATGPATELRLARADIAEQRPGRVSVMPAGLDEQLTRQELADLVAFLKASR
jgi:putative heme-binding domain-containing protein